jgi:hypothetical protein
LRNIALLLLFTPTLLFADDVYLQGGAKFSGRIVAQTDTMISIDIGDGVVGVALSRVDHVVKGRSALDEYDLRAAKMGPKDVQGWRALGHWAAQEGLSAQSRAAYQKVIALSPNDSEARAALGFVKLDGRWMTEEESYAARGFVKFEGEWMTPDEAKQAQEAMAAEQAQQEAERQANEAEIAKLQAEASAAKLEKQKKWDKSLQNWSFPVNMGGWGYGVSAWPATGTSSNTWLQQWPPPTPPPQPEPAPPEPSTPPPGTPR